MTQWILGDQSSSQRRADLRDVGLQFPQCSERECLRLFPGHCEVAAILRAEVWLVAWSFSTVCSVPQGFCFGVVFPRFFQHLRDNVLCLSRRRFYWEAKVNAELWGKVSKLILKVCVGGVVVTFSVFSF